MKTLIAIPCMDMMHTDFVRSLVGMKIEGEVQFTFAQASLIYDGRNLLANAAIDKGFERVLWLDSDMMFSPDLFRRLHERIDQGAELVTALCFARKAPIRPTIYRKCGLFDGVPTAESYHGYPEDSFFRVEACGFGACMTTVTLLRKVRDKYGLPFSPVAGFGEDLSFCLRARELGTELWCDSGIKVGHVGTSVYDEALYKRIREEQT